MPRVILELIGAVTGLAVGALATVAIVPVIHQPLAAHELPPVADHPCRAGAHAPYLDGDMVKIQGIAFVCDGYSGQWRNQPDPAIQQQIRAARNGALWSN
jgi:hypothetical protein